MARVPLCRTARPLASQRRRLLAIEKSVELLDADALPHIHDRLELLLGPLRHSS